MNRSGTLFAIAACALWGFAFVGPLLLSSTPPVVIAAGRYLAYGLTSLAALSLLGGLRQPLAVWGEALGLSLFGMVLYFVALSAALHKAGVVLPTLIIGMLPISIPLAACLLARRAPSLLQFLGFALTLLGTWLARPQGSLVAGNEVLMGTLLAVFSLLVWTFYALINSRLLQRRKAEITAQQWSALQGVACLPFVPLLMALGGTGFWAVQGSQWLLVSLVLGVLCSWLANGLWNAASTRLGAQQLGPLIVVETLAGLLYGRLWSGQPWDGVVWLGAALLLAGVLLALWGEGRVVMDNKAATGVNA